MAKIRKHKINFAEKNLIKKKERLEKLNMKPVGFVFYRQPDSKLRKVWQ